MNINLAGITFDSIVDGSGLRTTLFIQGCPHGCLGCHNPETWSFSDNQLWDVEKLVTILLSQPNKAVTFSGGEPFSQAKACAYIAKILKQHGFNLWSYSGYTFEQLVNGSVDQQTFLKEIDVLVDGPFILDKKALSLKFKGSTNQRIIDVQASLKQHQVILYQDVKNPINPSIKLYI